MYYLQTHSIENVSIKQFKCIFDMYRLLLIRNPFGGNTFGNGLAGPFPQPNFGQFGSSGAFFNGGIPFQGNNMNMFPTGNGVVLPPRSYSPGPISGPFGPSFGTPFVAGNGFINQPPFGEPTYFGSGSYDRPRSRHGSRHRSKSGRRRRHSRSSSSSDDEYRGRGSPFAGPGVPYENLQPFPNVVPLSPRAGSPNIPPRVPLW